MKLPHLITDEKSAHLLLLLLSTVNLLLIVIFFFLLVPGARKLLPQIVPISAKTPVVTFSLISPQPQSTVSGTVPLVTTLSNGPKIVRGEFYVDGQKVQAVTSQKTEKLTLFWDTTKHGDGNHNLQIKVVDDKQMSSSLSTSLNVQNNVKRTIGAR